MEGLFLNEIQIISIVVLIVSFILLIYFAKKYKKKGKETDSNTSKTKICDECGKRIPSFGGSFQVDGKTLCSKCEKKIRDKQAEIRNKHSIDNFEQFDENQKLLAFIEKVDRLIEQQRIANSYLNSISTIISILFLLFIIGLILLLFGL